MINGSLCPDRNYHSSSGNCKLEVGVALLSNAQKKNEHKWFTGRTYLPHMSPTMTDIMSTSNNGQWSPKLSQSTDGRYSSAYSIASNMFTVPSSQTTTTTTRREPPRSLHIPTMQPGVSQVFTNNPNFPTPTNEVSPLSGTFDLLHLLSPLPLTPTLPTSEKFNFSDGMKDFSDQEFNVNSDKSHRRREMNRMAQRRSRHRKEAQREQLAEQNTVLAEEIVNLRAEIVVYKNIVSQYEVQLSEARKEKDSRMDDETVLTSKPSCFNRPEQISEDLEEKIKLIDILRDQVETLCSVNLSQADIIKKLNEVISKQEKRLTDASSRPSTSHAKPSSISNCGFTNVISSNVHFNTSKLETNL